MPQHPAGQDNAGKKRLDHQTAPERLHHDHAGHRPGVKAAMRI